MMLLKKISDVCVPFFPLKDAAGILCIPLAKAMCISQGVLSAQSSLERSFELTHIVFNTVHCSVQYRMKCENIGKPGSHQLTQIHMLAEVDIQTTKCRVFVSLTCTSVCREGGLSTVGAQQPCCCCCHVHIHVCIQQSLLQTL